MRLEHILEAGKCRLFKGRDSGDDGCIGSKELLEGETVEVNEVVELVGKGVFVVRGDDLFYTEL
jgi:hypothetical protein